MREDITMSKPTNAVNVKKHLTPQVILPIMSKDHTVVQKRCIATKKRNETDFAASGIIPGVPLKKMNANSYIKRLPIVDSSRDAKHMRGASSIMRSSASRVIF